MTIEGHRKIKIMRGRGEQAATSTTGASTFWLAAEDRKPGLTAKSILRPFGWITLETPYDLPEEKPEVVTVSVRQPKQEIKTVVQKPPVVEKTALEKYCDALKLIKPTDAGKLGSAIDSALKALSSEDDKQQFALVVKNHMGTAFKKSKAKEKLKSFLD